jgi:DNA-binding response OmpR family regulator
MHEMDRPARVLIVEPDLAAGEALAGLIEEAGVRTAIATDGHEALQLFYAGRPDAVVLTLELPVLNGWEVLATVRELSDVPVLILADGDREADKVRALRAGANDFVSKPFGKPEILARIEVLLRHPRASKGPDMFADDFVQIDHLSHEVEALGAKIVLTPTEFRMLVAFSRHAGQALTHTQLLELVWGAGQRDRNEVKLYVSYLRRKLRAAGVEPIETVRGIGYRYRPHRVEEPPAAGETERRRL